MKNAFVVLVTFALAGSALIATAADVTGKVTLKGTPPAELAIPYNNDCAPLHPTQLTTRRYVVGKDNGLKDVFVYISKGCEGKTYPTPGTPVVIDQVGCTYQPYVIGAMVGQKVQFKNSDPLLHNIHATPKVDGNDEFNIPQTAQGQVDEKSFAKQEVLVRIKCDVHDWMFTYVGVCSNPYFAVTDENGNFKISGLPPGEYTLTAYHLRAHGTKPGVSQTIKVEGDKAVTADFTVEVPTP